ncbi:MAG: 2-(1,2-epoxy-1,2-dihydrophenyl)acetyl-CoA isomerase, partial [Alphaproteobacteria bacterium]
MSYQQILYREDEAVARIALNQPDKLNALSLAMLAELRDAVGRVADPDSGVRCLLLTGAGRGFCSGADLTDPELPKTAQGRFDAGALLHNHYHPLIKALAALEMPVVVAVNGAAVGAGMSFALAGDIVLAARSAYFAQAFVNIGLVPDAGATFLMPRLVGRARTLAAMMLGEKIPAETAQTWGLIHQAVDDDALDAAASALARRLAAGPTQALAGIRRLIQA